MEFHDPFTLSNATKKEWFERWLEYNTKLARYAFELRCIPDNRQYEKWRRDYITARLRLEEER